MRYIPVFAMFLSSALAGPVLALVSAPPVAGQPVLVIAAPWHGGAGRAIDAAGGRPLGPVSAPMARMAVSEDAEFAARLLGAGAWLVLDASRLAAWCVSPSSPNPD